MFYCKLQCHKSMKILIIEILSEIFVEKFQLVFGNSSIFNKVVQLG